MTIIMCISMLILIVSIIWVWHNLGNIEKKYKVAFIVAGNVIMYILTLIIYNVSKNGVIYPSDEIKQAISKTLIYIFTGLNSLLLLPYTANIFDNIFEEEADKKTIKKKIIILILIFIVGIGIENNYLKNTQKGIIENYNKEVQNAER